MKFVRFLVPLTFLFHLSAHAAEAPPAKALKYHEALLKRPSNETLFDRFFGAWIDEQDIAALEVFLKARAGENGGADLAVLARYQLRRGNEDEALATLGKAITAIPGDFSLPMERAKVLLRRLEFENARKDLATVAAGTDDNLALEASKLIGKSWLREGNPAEAIKSWDTLLAAHPGDEDLLEDLVESAAAEGETEQALKYVDKLIAAGSDPYKKTLRQLRRGDLLAQAGRHDDAVAAYSATLSDVGEGSWLEREVLAQIDKAYRKQDRLGELKTKLAELAAANPRRLLIHRQLAQIEAAQGETDAAVGRFREVLKRSPGNRELREEFVRLLTDGEKFDEAAEELEKLIALAPGDAGLLLQMADLRNREGNKETTLAALEKAHGILGDDEAAGIRIAGLMFQYGLGESGEKLLLKLAAAENATVAPSETLASEYARTNRKPEALAILEKIAASDNLETVLRSASSISALSESATALKVLSAKLDAFGQEPRFLASLAQAALTAGKPDIAVTHSVKLVRLAGEGAELAESIGIALRAINEADKSIEWRETLEKQDTRTPAETCLLASLADSHSDFDAVAKIMEGAEDPVVIRFHAALLDRRGEFERAIAVLSALAETDEGRKTSYFKDMTDLQRRAGLTEDALATVELWKQSAPGDKTAWIMGGSILREQGRPEDAVKAARQAVARFGEDADLAATLASLHEEAGQMVDAEAIYWRLYDESASPSDQARWAVKLAELAMRTGLTDELGEKLRERARGNRRSIGPILAQAELARVTRNEDKRRDLLLEAVRLQPNDIDLRLQIANLEEQSGNPDRVVAILEEAVAADPSNRIRSALAQAYLRQGQTLKGMRELRALAGKQADDPRAIEQSAATLAGSGLYEEAIRFLRETLPDGGDWRTKYLLAVMLEQDGRESEAIPLFQALRQATGELPGLKLPANNRNGRWDDYPQSVREIVRLMVAAQAAYAHRDQNNYGGYGGQGGMKVGPFMLPDTAETVQALSLVHLAKLGAEGLENAEFVKELTAAESGRQPDFPALLAKFPDQPGLLEIVLLYAGWNEDNGSLDMELLKKLVSEKKDLSAPDLYRAKLMIATSRNATDDDWKELADAASGITKGKNKNDLLQAGYQLLRILSADAIKIPEQSRKTLSETLIGLASSEEIEDGPLNGFKLAAINAVGTTEQWIEAANSQVEVFRKENPKGNSSPNMQSAYAMMGGYNNPWMGGGSPFSIPVLEGTAFVSLPQEVLTMIRPDSEDQGYYGFKPLDPAKLMEKLGSFDSPALRAWIAMRAGDEAATEDALSATPPENEAADFGLLRGLRAIAKKDHPSAFKQFSGLRPAFSSDRNRITSLNFALIAIAGEMTAEQRAPIAEELGALLIQARRALGPQSGEVLAAQAELLGLPELAKRFLPPATNRNTGGSPLGAASFGNRQSQSSQGGNPTIEKMQKFAAAGKNEAAAMEALNMIRRATASQSNRNYELRRIKEAITPGVIEELFKLIDPGESKSLTKLTEYADICIDFGKRDEALAVLTRLNKQRPDDAGISAKLAFLLPGEQSKLAMELISRSAAGDGFADIASATAESLSEQEDNARTFAFFSTAADWLESASPEEFGKANLTWVSYHAKNFTEGDYTRAFSDLGDADSQKPKGNKEYDLFVATAKRLALAMLRHDQIAEEGFRLLNHSQAWKIPDGEMDGHARRVLMAAATLRSNQYAGGSFFEYRSRNGSSRSGDGLNERSSVKWITTRLAAAKSPDEILPPAYLAELRGKDAGIGELVSSLANLKDIAGLEKLWKSDAMGKSPGPFGDMLREGVLSRAASLPGATGFFLERIRELEQGWATKGRYGSGESNTELLVAALKSSAAGDAKDLTAVCEAISKSIFGEKIELKDDNNGMTTYQAVNAIESIFEADAFDPRTAIRIHRTFFRLGIPVGTNDYSLSNPFHDVQIANPEDGAKLFASYGWLDDADKWEPFAAIILDAGQGPQGQITFTRKESFLVPEILSYIDFNFDRSTFAKHLENRKPQTFGALATAASMVQGTERGRLTTKAFALAAPKLAAMTPERLESFSPLIPWLPADALATLPAVFRKKAEGANAERLAELMKSADAFMKSAAANNNPYGNNPIDQVDDIVEQLAPLDLGKAVAVFLEAERRFTSSLTRGGRLFSYTSGGIQIPERDEALEDYIADGDSPLGRPALGLAFHNAIASSPEATRFSFSTSSTNTSVIFKIGWRIYESAANGSNQKEQQWVRALRNIPELPEEVRPDAYIALGTYLIGRTSVKVLREHCPPAAAGDLPAPARTMLTAVLGVRNWKTDKPEDREKTRDALISIAGDPKTPPTTRFQFFSMAATLGTAILADPAIAETFATLFEEYAKGERSVINGIGIYSNIVIRIAPFPATDKAVLARLNTAFWENANSPKPGGHPAIPPEFSDELLVSAAIVGDEPTTKKLLGIARPEVVGNLAVISPLIASGNFGLAKDMLADPGSFYTKSSGALPYGRSFEKRLNEFRKTPGLDPVALLRIEALLIDAPSVTGPDKPEESDARREQRLVEAYKANPPADTMLRTEILSRLTRDSHTAAIALRDEILALRKELDLRKSLNDWHNGTGKPTDPVPRYSIAPAESVIFRQAAFLEFLEGDTSGLEELAKIMAEQPPLKSVPENGDRYFVKSFLDRVHVSAPLWVCEAVHLGKTDGFAKAYDAFSQLSLLADKRPEFSAWDTTKPLTMAEFFAYWDGDPKKFEDLRKQLKRNSKSLGYLKDRWGFLQFSKIAKDHRMWKSEAFAESRRDFFVKAFSRKEMTEFYGPLQRWLPDTASYGGLRTEFLEIAANPPEGIVPTVLVHLLNFRANAEFSAKRFDSGLADAIAAIDVCPENGPWKDIRFRLQVALMDRLIGAKTFDKAKEVYAGFSVDKLNEFQKKRHKELGEKLAKAQQ